MNDEMKKGMLLVYQSVKEEMDTIKAELKRKGRFFYSERIY